MKFLSFLVVLFKIQKMSKKQYEYEFIEDIMDDSEIYPEEREKFYREVYIPYVNDSKFHWKVHGKKVLFLKNVGEKKAHLEAIVKDTKTALEYHKEGKRIVYYIGDDQPMLSMYYSRHEHHPIYYDNVTKVHDTINVRVNFDLYGHKTSTNYILDSGASVTTLFYPEHWNYETKYFKESNTGLDDLFINLNKNNIFRERQLSGMANGKGVKVWTLGYKPNISLRIGNLPPVMNQIFTIPVKEPKRKPEMLLGIDMISKHTIIFSKFEGQIGALIMPLMEFTSINNCRNIIENNSFQVLNQNNVEFYPGSNSQTDENDTDNSNDVLMTFNKINKNDNESEKTSISSSHSSKESKTKYYTIDILKSPIRNPFKK